MPHIAPLDAARIDDAELLALMARAEALGVPDGLFTRIVARVPSYAKVLLKALLVSHEQGTVDHKLKEVMRIQLARFAGDTYFSGLRSKRALAAGLDEATIDEGCNSYEQGTRFTEAEKMALRYADMMFLDANQVDKAFYDKLKLHYTEAQIMELGGFIAFHYGMQAFMRTLNAVPAAMMRADVSPNLKSH